MKSLLKPAKIKIIMRKLFSIFAVLTLSVGLWANTITYTATEGLGAINANIF